MDSYGMIKVIAIADQGCVWGIANSLVAMKQRHATCWEKWAQKVSSDHTPETTEDQSQVLII